jgi:hypothetical protein
MTTDTLFTLSSVTPVSQFPTRLQQQHAEIIVCTPSGNISYLKIKASTEEENKKQINAIKDRLFEGQIAVQVLIGNSVAFYDTLKENLHKQSSVFSG